MGLGCIFAYWVMGLVCIFAVGENYCSHQFLNWWQPHATGMWRLDHSSPIITLKKKERTSKRMSVLFSGVGNGTRTHNARNHNPVLCQLNYTHHIKNGTPEGTRTPDLLLRRQLLYPAELLAHLNGAGDGNRTRVSSLEGWCSTIELHPQIHANLADSARR